MNSRHLRNCSAHYCPSQTNKLLCMKIDIIFSLDSTYLSGLLATVNSIVQNTPQPERLRFNLIIPEGETQFFETQIAKYFPIDCVFKFQIKEYKPSEAIQQYIANKYQPTTQRANALYMLFSRLFLNDIFPDLKKVIFLDTDIVVIEDIAKLYDSMDFSEQQYFAAVPHFFPAIFHFSNPFKALRELRQFKKTFNGGVLFTDLSFWSEKYAEKLEYYLNWDKQCGYKLFQLNDETVLNLTFKDYFQLDRRWNRCGFGNMKLISWLLKKDLSEIAIVHWSGGHHKPWNSADIAYGDIWQKYKM
jgi:lipopolysaccharide biosynthesis glycosyltransferase